MTVAILTERKTVAKRNSAPAVSPARSFYTAAHRAISCASSITSAHRERLRRSRTTESNWKTWLLSRSRFVPNISGGDAYASLAELRVAGNGE
jgi:hypothetical protein